MTHPNDQLEPIDEIGVAVECAQFLVDDLTGDLLPVAELVLNGTTRLELLEQTLKRITAAADRWNDQQRASRPTKAKAATVRVKRAEHPLDEVWDRAGEVYGEASSEKERADAAAVIMQLPARHLGDSLMKIHVSGLSEASSPAGYSMSEIFNEMEDLRNSEIAALREARS